MFKYSYFPRYCLGFAIILAGWTLAGCGENGGDSSALEQPAKPAGEKAGGEKVGDKSAKGASNSQPRKTSPPANPRFVDVAKALGIEFSFYPDAVPDRYFLPEVMGGGAAWLDFDLDGAYDLYLMNGCRLKDRDPRQTEHLNRLFRSDQARRFVDVTLASSAADNGYGQGCAVGDFDSDGFDDLYVCNYGPNVLLRNNGDGTFQDVTQIAQVGGGELWSSSAVWCDLDGDHDLDLYVANYLDVNLKNSQVCKYGSIPGYCGPGSAEAVDDLVYVNQGNGQFVESSKALGLFAEGGKGLALIVADFDHDLKPEIYVANDMMPNFLFTRAYKNLLLGQPAASQPGKPALYANVARNAGCAVSDEGQHEASMGIACGDFDRDGLPDMFLTHYHNAKNTFYHNLGNLIFEDDSRRTNTAPTSYDTLGFGALPLDFDLDGHLDVFVANGHVLGPKHNPFAMKPQLLHNTGPDAIAGTFRFEDVSDSAGAYFRDFWLGRGAAGADFDNDGDTDFVVSHLRRPIVLMRNDTPRKGAFLGLDLYAADRHRPIGGRVEVFAGEKKWIIPVMAGGSYLSSNDPRLLVGLGPSQKWVKPTVKLVIHWPSGHVDQWEEIPVNRYHRIVEGQPLESSPESSTE